MSIISAIFYYFIFTILLRHPYVLVAVVAAYLLRDRIPSPSAWLRRQRQFARLKYEVAVNPYDSVAGRNIGMVLLDKGRPAEALTHLLEALKKEPGSAEINHLVGLSYLRGGKPDDAVGYLTKSIEVEPRFRYGESHLYLGEALLAKKDVDEAIGSFKTYLSINNTSIEGLYGYASALTAAGRKDEAKKAAQDGIMYHKANPSFRRRRDWRWYVRLKGFKRTI